MGAPRSETVGGYVRQRDVLVLEIDHRRGVWECSSRFCHDPRGTGPLVQGASAVAAWWEHIRRDHADSEWA